jgi:hypothetical protein
MGGVSGRKITQGGVVHRESTVLDCIYLYLYLHLRDQESRTVNGPAVPPHPDQQIWGSDRRLS